jgi:uncharacterized membrane protein YbaN (DUF454 family)
MPAVSRSANRTPLAEALWEADRTGRWLARKLSVQESQVSRWCRGRAIPTLARQEAIVAVLVELGLSVSVESLWPSDGER